MTFRVSKYIQQPAWRVWLLHCAAKALGVLAHVEGMPIGSNRLPAWKPTLGSMQSAHLDDKT